MHLKTRSCKEGTKTRDLRWVNFVESKKLEVKTNSDLNKMQKIWFLRQAFDPGH